jgi:predicted MFS family arabinose efflux permease
VLRAAKSSWSNGGRSTAVRAIDVLEVQHMHERWLVLAVLTFARIAVGFQFESVSATSHLLVDRFHLGYAALGTLIGLYLLPGIAVALPGGVMAQRYGDKRIVCAGLVAMILGGALMALAGDLPLLLAGRVLSGAGAVLLNVVVSKMVTDWFQGHKVAFALGILVTSWPLGIAIALVALPMFANAFDWAAAMDLTAIISIAALLLVAAFYRSPASGHPEPARRLRVSLSGQELSLSILAGLVWTFYNIGFIIVPAFGPAFLATAGFGAETASAIVSTASWVIIPAVPFGAWLAEQIGRPIATMIVSFVLSACAIAAVTGVGASVALFAVIGLTFGPPGGLIMALPGEAATPQHRAAAMGVYYTCYYAGNGVLPALAGYARDVSGRPAAALWFAVAMLVLATASLLVFEVARSRFAKAAVVCAD